MSNYSAKAFNPSARKYEMADFLDNYYGPHQYAVKFKDGGVWREDELSGYEPVKNHILGVKKKVHKLPGATKPRFTITNLGRHEEDDLLGKLIEDGAKKASRLVDEACKDLLITILAQAESLKTAREVRHLIKDYILELSR